MCLGVWGLGFPHCDMTTGDAEALLPELSKVSAPYGVIILTGVPAGWRSGAGEPPLIRDGMMRGRSSAS